MSEIKIIQFNCIIISLQTDKRTGNPKIWIYKDRQSGQSKGECTVTYDDQHTAQSAIQWFNGKSHAIIITLEILVS